MSIHDNIAYGLRQDKSYSLDQIEAQVLAASKLAHAHSFIQNLPHQYQTQVGEKGPLRCLCYDLDIWWISE